MRDDGFRRDNEIAVLIRAVDRSLQRLLEIRNEIACISAENLISTLTAKDYLDLARSKLGDHVLRKRPRPCHRRVEVIDDLLDIIPKILCRDLNLLEVDPALTAGDLRIRTLIVAWKLREFAMETYSSGGRFARCQNANQT